MRPVWLALEAACGTELPFQTWEWSVAWWAHLHEDGRGVRDLLRVCVVRDESGTVLGIAPLILTERPAVGPLRVRHMQFIGPDPNITEIRTMLCRPAYERQCDEALRRYLASRASEWDWIAWEGLSAQFAADNASGQAVPAAQEKSDFVLALAPTWDDMKRGLRPNIKESLRKCYNSLRRHGLTRRLEIVDQPDALGPALADFFRLHTARASLSGAPRHSDVFASRRARAFLIDVCERLAQRGIAKIYRLWVDDKVVATRIGFEMFDGLYLYYSGWDTAYAQYSVMTTLVAEVLQYAILRGIRSVHLSTGQDVSKMRWGPHEVGYLSMVELSPHVSARALHLAYEAARRVGAGRIVHALTPALFLRRADVSPV